VVRLAGNTRAVGRGQPVAALVTHDARGRPVLGALPVAGPRDDALLERSRKPGRIALAQVDEPGTVAASVTGGSAPPEMDSAVAAMEDAPGRPWLLVRSIGVDPSRPVEPSAALITLPAEPPTPARFDVTGLPAGVRLVVAAIVAPDRTPADPRTLHLAWIPVSAVDDAGVAPH
jgi:hypothetical protein